MANLNIDLVKKVFERRLQQADLDAILAALSSEEQDELVRTIGEFLQRISTLVEISSKASDSLSLDVLLPRLMDIVTEAMNADRSTLFLHDPDTDELFSRVLQGESIGDIRFPSHLGIAGAVFHERKAVVTGDAYEDPRFNPDFDKQTGYRTRNMLCVPVLAKDGQAIGAFQVLNKHKGHFDDSDRALLEALTSQAASALENARLFQEVQRQQKEEAQLLEVTEVISSNLQLDELLNQVIRIVTEMLNADRSSLFMYDSRTGELWSRVAEGLDEKEIRFPSFAGIAGSCFTSGEPINIPDTYADERFNRDVDRRTGYRTRNMLCMPVANKDGRKLGVLQVLNKRKGPFNRNDENRLRAFSYQVAIALENAQLFEDVLNERNFNESILRSLSNGVMTLDAGLRVTKANDALIRMLHRGNDDITGRSASSVFSEDQNRWILDSIENVKQSGRTDITMDADILLAGGGTSSVNLTVVPLVNIGKEQIGFMLVFEDITKEKRVKSTMARYMTKEVADRLLDVGEDVLGGTAQWATVLFSDIRGFTTISEELGARETVSLLNEYFTDMIDVIFNHGGILDKYIGDAIMAVFGTPFEKPDDADNAVRVANEMMRVLRVFNEKQRKQGRVELRIGVGMATGELVAGNIGSLKRMDYTAIGDTVNLASRLESATKYYGVNILWSEATAKALHNEVRHREIDLIRVKGKNEPVSIFEGLDHHSTGTFPYVDRVLDRFEQGISLYRKRNWKKAIGCFESALDLHRRDVPSQIYLERCRHYLETPPADDWDGVWVMTEK
ncbi:MAG: GAF domain-containing protein [Arenicellales bacterium]